MSWEGFATILVCEVVVNTCSDTVSVLQTLNNLSYKVRTATSETIMLLQCSLLMFD